MSKVAITEVLVKKCLLDMPYEMLLEIFSGLPKSKLIKISRLCSKFRVIAGDTRLWKDVYIKYNPKYSQIMKETEKVLAFEELYSEPWPVKVIDLSGTQINPPVFRQTEQIIKVNRLDLSSVTANEVTMEAILAKYQCRELCLDFNKIDRMKEIKPEEFSKQTALEIITVGYIRGLLSDKSPGVVDQFQIVFRLWLKQVLSNCKNLKTLNLQYTTLLSNSDLLCFVENLPASLEKLFLEDLFPEESFFALLAEKTPNLRELRVIPPVVKSCPSLLKFQFLEALHVHACYYEEISDLFTNLIKFPALKTVYLNYHPSLNSSASADLEIPENIEKFRTTATATLDSHGITVEVIKRPHPWHHPTDCTVWNVSKAA